MVMTKTEYKKKQVKEVLAMLENRFDAVIEDNGEGGRMSIEINGFNGEFSRRDLDVCFWDTTKLVGRGWSEEQIQRQKDAVELDNCINESIKSLLEYMRYLEPAE